MSIAVWHLGLPFQFLYHGINFMNKSEEQEVRSYLESGGIANAVERSLTHEEEDALKAICANVANWSQNAKIGDGYLFELDVGCSIPQYVLQQEIRGNFPHIWTARECERVKLSSCAE